MIIPRFIASELLRGWIIVVVILASLFSLLSLIQEIDNLNERYQFANALKYVVLTTPQRILELSPVVTALGTIMAFAKISRTNELVIIRTAGFSLRRIMFICTLPTLTLVVMLYLAEEFWVAAWYQKAETERTVQRSNNLDILEGKGLWSHNGKRFLNVRNMRSGQIPEQISIYEFGADGRLALAIDAARAELAGRHWNLIDVQYKESLDGKLHTRHLDQLELGPFWSADELPVLGQSLATMSPSALLEYARYLESTGQPFAQADIAFWQKIALPLSAASMVVLSAAIGLGFSTARNTSFGWRVLTGTIVGVGLYLLTQIMHTTGQIMELNGSVVVVLPIVLTLALSGMIAMRTRGPR